MRYVQVIHDAWDLTTRSPKLKWFVFIPAFASVVAFIAESAWQIFMFSAEFGILEHDSAFGALKEAFFFVQNNGLLMWTILFTVFILLFEFLLPAWITSTLILSIRHEFATPEKPLSLRHKMIEGFRCFFPVFEINAILSPFAFVTIGLFTATMYRFYHGGLFGALLPIILIYSAIALTLNVFLSYTHYFVICEEESVKKSIKKSVAMVFLFFGRTMMVIMLMILVNIRILVNVIVILGVPLGIIATLSYFASSEWFTFAMILASILGFALTALAAYLTAIIEVFSTAVWVRTFYTLREDEKKFQTDINEDRLTQELPPLETAPEVPENTPETISPPDSPLNP